MIKIAIEKDGKQYYANGDKVFSWLYERYVKNEGRKTKGRVVPYSQKLDNFFKEIVLDEEWLSDMGKAFPGINVKNELDKAKMWLISNKSHKKDLKKFCYNWVSRATPDKVTTQDKTREDVIRDRKNYNYNKNVYSEEDCADAVEIKDILKNYKDKNERE